ncbi:hypothetical protein Hanom_Chr17g01587871 [Helianthus anomalus]
MTAVQRQRQWWCFSSGTGFYFSSGSRLESRVWSTTRVSSRLGSRVKTSQLVRMVQRVRVLDRRSSWFGSTRLNRVDSVKSGQDSELTRLTQPVNLVDSVNPVNVSTQEDGIL